MKTLFFILTLAFTYSFIGCNNQKETAENVKKEWTEKAQITDTDSLLIAYERGVCFGKCPEDKLVIYKSGFAVYNGIRNVNVEGFSTAKISDDLLMELNEKLKKINLSKVEAEYGMSVSDLPSKTLTFNIDNTRKTSLFKSNDKQEIKDILKVLNAIVDTYFKK